MWCCHLSGASHMGRNALMEKYRKSLWANTKQQIKKKKKHKYTGVYGTFKIGYFFDTSAE